VYHQKWYHHNIDRVTTPNAPKQKIYKKFIQDEFLPYFKEHDPEKYIAIRSRLKNKEWSQHSRKNSYAFLAYTKEQTIDVLSGKMKIEDLLKFPERTDSSMKAVIDFWRNKAYKRLEKKQDEIKQSLIDGTWNEFYDRQSMRHGPSFKIVR